MFCIRRRAATVCAGLVAALAWSTSSLADDSAPAGAESAHPASGGGALVAIGFITFGLSYVPAVSTATTSQLPIDKHLLVPVAGPWIDLAQRPICSPPANCQSEQTNRALLETTGILQGVGAFLTIVGLLTPDDTDTESPKHTSEAKATTVHVTPAQFGSAYGLAAFGKF